MAALPAALKYRRPPGYRRFHALKPQLAKIERVYKRIDHTDGIVLGDPLVKAFRQ